MSVLERLFAISLIAAGITLFSYAIDPDAYKFGRFTVAICAITAILGIAAIVT